MKLFFAKIDTWGENVLHGLMANGSKHCGVLCGLQSTVANTISFHFHNHLLYRQERCYIGITKHNSNSGCRDHSMAYGVLLTHKNVNWLN